MLRVRDIMTSRVIGLADHAPLEVAAWILASEGVTGAPVRDSRGNLIGVLSRSDLSDPRRRGSENEVVSDAMTLGAWAVHPDDSVMDAVQLMLDKRIHRVLAASGPGQIAGIVSTTDILQALVDGRLAGEQAATGQSSLSGVRAG